MNYSLLKMLPAFMCLLTVGLFAFEQKEAQDPATNVPFPSQISFQGNGKQFNLNATGTSTRKKFFVKVYTLAHYLQDNAKQGPDKFATIIDDDNAKQFTVKWLVDAPTEKIKNGWHDSFQAAISDGEKARLQNEINQFISFFSRDAKKGDEYIYRYIPGGKVEVLFNGQTVGAINSPLFAKALWSIWFGPKSVVNRDQLIANIK